MKPKDHFFQKIVEISKKIGDIKNLSIVDMKVLALALELKNIGSTPLIITDDYSIQNVANKIDIKFYYEYFIRNNRSTREQHY